MRTLKETLLLAAFVASTSLLSAQPASALPLSPATGGLDIASRLTTTQPIIEVRNRGGQIAAGIIGGAILGGIIASQGPRYYGYGYPAPYYQPYPYYPAYPAYPYYRRPVMGDPAIAYCMSRYRSYDPYSMTYAGFDGYRHPCP